ncbi:hypothetical protein [Micromonospora zhanjiangensis]|uniref:Mce-associated membrane protein n=1 Tax=Micromonospora zhanjiangensis TaxID=1522057 RepID=A0ABV8KE99_9ACTN
MQPPAGSQTSHVPAQRTPPVETPGAEPVGGPTPMPVPGIEPIATPAGPAGPAPALPAAPRRNRRRIVLAVLGGLLALAVMGAGTLFYLYDRATAPDRSAPDVTVDNYLRAYLVDRNDALADQFVCEGSTDLAALRALRAEAERREAQFNVSVRVSWGPLQRSKTATGETVRVTLTIRSFADGQDRAGRREDWAFDLAEDDGWRVCSARKEG